MKLPVSWLQDFVDIRGISIEDIARRLTLAGLEVEEIIYVGLPMPAHPAVGRYSSERREFKTSGIAWDPEKIVVAEIYAVNPHPNADRLVLCDLFDGRQQHVVLTGAPNLFQYKGKGRLPKPIKVAYAKEGATLYDGHADHLELMTLKRTKIRGVESYSMACSEKELGISDEHEGIILLDDDAPVGRPLAEYIGDAVLDISIEPNMARNANVLGVARELAALTGRELIKPSVKYQTTGKSIGELASIEITEPELNPRFVLGLIRDVEIKPSPYHVQRRLKLAGMRPINCIVDASNYAMLELGQPLHAFDYDVLVGRVANPTQKIKIITRTAKEGEKLTTLDGSRRTFTPSNVLVCDEKGALSIAGIMGGSESEVYDASGQLLDAKGMEITPAAGTPPGTATDDAPAAGVAAGVQSSLRRGKVSSRAQSTTNILLEGAAWNFINIRRTAKQHNLPSEASFRFSRGVHPALAEMGVKRGLQLMAEWSGGVIAPGLVDEYPLKPDNPTVELTSQDAERLLGIKLSLEEIAALLEHLEFKCKVTKNELHVTAPPHRLDIGEGVVGLADVLEEVARLYGYDRIPEARMADELPPQVGNLVFEWEQHLRDVLAALGLQEVVGYRLTSPEREALLTIPVTAGAAQDSRQQGQYLALANPITPERRVLRRHLVASVLDILERNARLGVSFAFFEIGPVFEPRNNELPDELSKLAIVMTGQRQMTAWDVKAGPLFDFYDLKGRIEHLLHALHYSDVSYAAIDSVQYLHPGKSSVIKVNETRVGVLGELHPLVKARYEFTEAPVLVAEFDLQTLRALPPAYEIEPVPEFPAILEDIAVILDESIPASRVQALIREAGAGLVTDVRLFDVYRAEQLGPGRKSLAYHLIYQAPDKTLTDAEAAAIRNKIVRRLEQELGAKLRS